MRASYANQQSDDLNQNLTQANIASVLTAIAKNPILNGAFLNIPLTSSSVNKSLNGDPSYINLPNGQDSILNHGLGRPLIGWLIVSLQPSVIGDSGTIYDKQNLNTPTNGGGTDKTLILATTMDHDVSARIYVF